VIYSECTGVGPNTIAVISIVDFIWGTDNKDGSADTELLNNLNNFVSGINRASQNGITRLVVDVSENPGGDVALGILTHFLLTGSDISRTATPWDMKVRKTVENLFNCMGNSPCCFNVTTGTLFSGISFVSDQQNWRNVTRGNRKEVFSGLFSFLDRSGATNAENLNLLFQTSLSGDSVQTANDKINTLPPTRPFTQIILFGDGHCASTCSVFTTLMHFVPPPSSIRYQVVQYGGLPGIVMDSSIVAANVIEVGEIFALPVREMLIPTNTNLTRQFSRIPPDVILPGWSAPNHRNRLPLLAQAIQLFT